MTLRAENVQVAFVEMQVGIVESSRTQPAEALRRAARTIRSLADALAIPVSASGVALRGESPQPIDELGPIDWHVRTSIGLFGDATMREVLVNRGRETLALAGMSSEIAVLHTALEARQAGLDVHVLVDACGGLSDRSEAAALAQMQSAGVVMSNVSTFFTGLVRDMTSKEGTSVMKALADLWGWER